MSGFEKPDEAVDWSNVQVSLVRPAAKVNEMIADRERARGIAVRLEQELAEVQSRLSVARAVTAHWHASYLEGLRRDAAYAIGTHPLGLVLDALEGETDPLRLAVPAEILEGL